MFYFYKYSLQDHKAITENDGEWLPSSPVGKYLNNNNKKKKSVVFTEENASSCVN